MTGVRKGYSKKTNVRTGSKNIREQECNYRIFLIAVVIAIFVFILCSSAGSLWISSHGNRAEEPVNFKYYKSIVIETGDTLWDIAETYMPEDYDSIADYVCALKEMNNLDSDEIHEGQNLMVAYNDTEFHK